LTKELKPNGAGMGTWPVQRSQTRGSSAPSSTKRRSGGDSPLQLLKNGRRSSPQTLKKKNIFAHCKEQYSRKIIMNTYGRSKKKIITIRNIKKGKI
jgi:hypothetical protein